MYIPRGHPHNPIVLIQYRAGKYEQQQGARKIEQHAGHDTVGGSPSARRPYTRVQVVKIGYAIAGNDKRLYRSRIRVKVVQALKEHEIEDAGCGKNAYFGTAVATGANTEAGTMTLKYK